jgi:hydroxymethylpyrimidine pyrophosphatase-like HAD family hydrolase
MKYKLIAIDIDGTLANGFNKISKKNLDALHKYYKKGGEIVICTGRSLLTTLDTVEKIETAIEGKIKYVICSKGAYIYDRINDKNYTYLIPDNTVRDLLFCCQRLKISF